MTTPRQEQASAWLLKSDLTAFERCPQGFWLLKTGVVTHAAAPGTNAAAILDEGTAFDRQVRDTATPLVNADGKPATLDQLLDTDRFVLCDHLFGNAELRLAGKPDGIAIARGRLEPAEIKNRTQPRPRDLVELAFYWLVLEPYRTVKDADPHGWLLLKDPGGQVRERIRTPIPSAAFAEVHHLATEARSALREGIGPYWHDCEVCAQCPQLQTPSLRATAPVGCVRGLGPKNAGILNSWGITSVGELLEQNSATIVGHFRAAAHGITLCDPDAIDWGEDEGEGEGEGDYDDTGTGTGTGTDDVDVDDTDWVELLDRAVPKIGKYRSIEVIEHWREQADVFVTNQPRLQPGQHPPIPHQFIALDLEYRPEEPAVVWSACAHTVGVDAPHRITLVADTEHQGNLLARLTEFLATYPHLPILTWNGNKADFPQLVKVANRHPMPPGADLPAALDDIKLRHTDLLKWAERAVLLPTTNLTLELTAKHFGIPDTSGGMTGFSAARQWENYQHTRDQQTRHRLIDYNRSDVTTLARIAQHLKALHESSEPATAPASFNIDELECFETPSPSEVRGGGVRASTGDTLRSGNTRDLLRHVTSRLFGKRRQKRKT